MRLTFTPLTADNLPDVLDALDESLLKLAAELAAARPLPKKAADFLAPVTVSLVDRASAR